MTERGVDWTRVVACGFAGGLIINAIEWLAHRMWLDPEWTRAFAALGKAPMGWTTFIAANFLVGVFAVWAYRWLSNIYGRGTRTALRAAAAIWIIFWVIPIMGMQPMNLFPDHLLVLVVGVGVIDAALGTLPAIFAYEKLSAPVNDPESRR